MIERKKRSIIWKIEKQELEDIVRRNKTITSILLHFGLPKAGNNSHTLKKRMEKDNIDFSHIPLGLGNLKGRHFSRKDKIPLENILVVDSSYSRSHLKIRLLRENVLKEECEKCHIKPIWNGEKLVLQLDHKNGIGNDNRLENLRLLCPNCHSQTNTFTGKIFKKKPKRFNCLKCGGVIKGTGKLMLCRRCSRKSKRKVERPPSSVLLEQIEEKGFVGTGKMYGVSDNAIRKWLKMSLSAKELT